jgi:hypothetical protein
MNVVKVNIGADIFRTWMAGVKEGAQLESGDSHEPPHHIMMNHASKKVADVARAKLSLMGASSHAKPLLGLLEDATKDLEALSAKPQSV